MQNWDSKLHKAGKIRKIGDNFSQKLTGRTISTEHKISTLILSGILRILIRVENWESQLYKVGEIRQIGDNFPQKLTGLCIIGKTSTLILNIAYSWSECKFEIEKYAEGEIWLFGNNLP